MEPACAFRPSAPRRIKQVLEAAQECFRVHGFHGASVAQIAAAANMSVGHIYRYFPGKEDIIFAIVEQDSAAAMADFNARHDGAPVTITDFLDYLRSSAERMSNPQFSALWLEIMAEAARNPRAAQVVRTARRGMTERLLAFLQSEACNRQSDEAVHQTVDMLLLLIDSIALRLVIEPNYSPQREVDRLMCYAHGVFDRSMDGVC